MGLYGCHDMGRWRDVVARANSRRSETGRNHVALCEIVLRPPGSQEAAYAGCRVITRIRRKHTCVGGSRYIAGDWRGSRCGCFHRRRGREAASEEAGDLWKRVSCDKVTEHRPKAKQADGAYKF